jgi:hypothetical protein
LGLPGLSEAEMVVSMNRADDFAFPTPLTGIQAEIDEMIAPYKAQWLRPIQSSAMPPHPANHAHANNCSSLLVRFMAPPRLDPEYRSHLRSQAFPARRSRQSSDEHSEPFYMAHCRLFRALCYGTSLQMDEHAK